MKQIILFSAKSSPLFQIKKKITVSNIFKPLSVSLLTHFLLMLPFLTHLWPMFQFYTPPLETPENLRFHGITGEYKKVTLAKNGSMLQRPLRDFGYIGSSVD